MMVDADTCSVQQLRDMVGSVTLDGKADLHPQCRLDLLAGIDPARGYGFGGLAAEDYRAHVDRSVF